MSLNIFTQGERLLASSPPGALWVPAVLLAMVAALVLFQQRRR